MTQWPSVRRLKETEKAVYFYAQWYRNMTKEQKGMI